MSNSVELWRGLSSIDAMPIVLLASGLETGSSNGKTGNMLQTYILRADMPPNEAVKMGEDASICGDCTHRGNGDGTGRTCYVNYGQGPLSVWNAWYRGNVPFAPSAAAVGLNRKVRIGSYGDPGATPFTLWQALVAFSEGRTGYTHQWRTHPWLQAFCMASVESEAEALEARALGWRTFRVAFPGDTPRLPWEARCPMSAEMGYKLPCEDCLACCGNAGGRSGGIVIQAHGGFAVMANIRKRR